VEKPEERRTLRRPRRRLVDNIKMDIGETGFGGIDWIILSQDRDKWRALVNGLRTVGFHKITGSPRVAVQPVASREMLRSMEFVSSRFERNVV
jgi:hypothetical protein